LIVGSVRCVYETVFKEDGSGDLVNGATIYNFATGEWIDDTNYTNFAIGLSNAGIVFPMGDKVLVDGVEHKATEKFQFGVDRIFTSVRSISADGKVIGANIAEVHEGTGQLQYFPLIIVLDEPIVAGIDTIVSENGVSIIVSEGRIDVAGTEDVTVFNLNGSIVSKDSTSHVAPGVYVVKAGDTTRKVLVK
ncbi:MAG: hypothetical protein K2L31_08845, partial [Muribaculum sp.]|nr:hypothetical protein [Muribaculum sp.]